MQGEGGIVGVGLFTNSTARQDFVHNGIIAAATQVQDVFIASAFFTESRTVEQIAQQGCNVRLIVRLGFPTSPGALASVSQMAPVQVRYFADSSFHPKLYVFGDRQALVGSANLTGAALLSNQEVVVSIGADDERFSELALVFAEYWAAAKVVTPETLGKYQAIYNRHLRISKDIEDFDFAIEEEIGAHVFCNIGRSAQKPTLENIFLDSYRKTYQESVAAFRRIREVYAQAGNRKFGEDVIPLRLEIDSFLSFVRDTHTQGESWIETPLGWNDTRRRLVEDLVREWLATPWPHFEITIVQHNYPRLLAAFSSRDHLLAATDDGLFDALLTIHSFHDRLRFFNGGLGGLRAAFFGGNDGEHMRESLAHLVFGAGDVVERMAALLFDVRYRLNHFGRANVQELVGWINTTDLPVINGRTTKVLRYFGLDVRQL